MPNPPSFLNQDIDNFMKRGFVRTKDDLNPFTFAQDPTFLSFKVEFFPADTVLGPDLVGETVQDKMQSDPFLVHNLAHDCLLRPPKYQIDGTSATLGQSDTWPFLKPVFKSNRNPDDYGFADSAEDYLYAIGSVNRIGYLRAFKQLLYKLETQAPWFFQKIVGAGTLYTLDPNVNTRKDGVLTFECLETVDMRMSMLADFYRQAAFDFERYREVLPYNLRTFRMKIHVFEMRNFNTTSGNIAGVIAGTTQREFEEVIKNKAAGSISGGNSQPDSVLDKAFNKQQQILASQFDAISMQTYELGLCEFDFYSQAPSFLEELSVAEIPQATSTFKIKFGTVRKTAKYSFYKYLTDYVIHHSLFPNGGIGPFSSIDVKNPIAKPFYDADVRSAALRRFTSQTDEHETTRTKNIAGETKNSIADLEKRKAADEIGLGNENEYGNRAHVPRPTGLGGLVLGAAESAINTGINRIQSRIQHALLGNAFDNIPSPAEASQALLGFINPNLGLTLGPGERPQTANDPGNVNFEPVTVEKQIDTSPFEPLTVDQNISGGGFDPLSNMSPIVPDTFDPLSVNNNISTDSFVPLPLYSAISPGGFDPLSVDTNISADTLVPLPVDNTIGAGGFDPPPSASSIVGTGLDPLATDTDIFQTTFSETPVDTDIFPLPKDMLLAEGSLSKSPMESGPKPGDINPKSANFELNEQSKTIKNKSVGFEKAPEQPQISPKNVYTRNI